jgi:hypothetical protein
MTSSFDSAEMAASNASRRSANDDEDDDETEAATAAEGDVDVGPEITLAEANGGLTKVARRYDAPAAAEETVRPNKRRRERVAVVIELVAKPSSSASSTSSSSPVPLLSFPQDDADACDARGGPRARGMIILHSLTRKMPLIPDDGKKPKPSANSSRSTRKMAMRVVLFLAIILADSIEILTIVESSTYNSNLL